MGQFEQLKKHFARIGAPLRMDLYPNDRFWHRRLPVTFSLGVQTDRKTRQEYFLISVIEEQAEFHVLDANRAMKHLLIQACTAEDQQLEGNRTTHSFKFLCGHDERHWFVAGVAPRATSLITALESLKPEDVKTAQAEIAMTRAQRLRRKNRAYVRQGEWFFLPTPDLVVDGSLILKHEAIRRGAGSPHWVQELYRCGGTTVYVCRQHPLGVTENTYRELLENDPSAKQWNWQTMKRDMTAYARGYVKHRDHRTIRLPFWHRVVMNAEYVAPFVIGVNPNVFLD